MEIKLSGKRIIFHDAALQIFEKFAQNQPRDPEAGGILLGKVFEDRVEILKVSIPTPLDKASRFNFERHVLSAQIIINYEFYNSHNQLIYLGEWHTHPENTPNPSRADLKMIKNQFEHNKLNVDFILLVIRGLQSFYIRLVGQKNSHEITITTGNPIQKNGNLIVE